MFSRLRRRRRRVPPPRVPVVTSRGVSSIPAPRRRRGRASWKWSEKRPQLDYLQNYLTMSDVDKARDLAIQEPHALLAWAGSRPNLYYPSRPLPPRWLHARLERLIEEDRHAEIEKLVLRLPAPLLARGFYASTAATSLGQYTETPSYLHMDFARRNPRAWLVHFTDWGMDIACDGFTIGSEDYTQLGLTTHRTNASKPGGYNFAFPLDTAERDARKGHGYWKYGKEIVLFTAPAVVVDHFGDNESQHIFWGADARQIVYVDQDSEKGDFCVGEQGDYGDPIFCAEELATVGEWVANNWQQYSRQLSCNGRQPNERREHRSGRRR